MTTHKERRKHPRFPFHCKGELRIELIPCLGELVDFSQFGALFRSGIIQVGLESGQKCSLDILHLNNNLLCTVEGRVAHRHENLVGIELDALDEERLNKILQAGALNLAPPKLFNRSLAALLQAA